MTNFTTLKNIISYAALSFVILTFSLAPAGYTAYMIT